MYYIKHAVLQSWRKLFFLSDIGLDRNWGSVLPMGFVSVPPFYCNIVYHVSIFIFFLYKTECKITYSHDH